jgi:polyferredoxin
MSIEDQPRKALPAQPDAGKGKGEKSKSQEGLVAFLNLIPTVYYDLIARVAPGLTLLIALVAFKWGRDIPAKESLSIVATTPALVVILLISYVLGMILTSAAFFWDFLSFFVLGMLFGNSKLGWWCLFGRFTEAWAKCSNEMDEVAKLNEGAGSTLGKMMAETSLCENLLSGLLVLVAIGWLSAGVHFYHPNQYPILYGSMATLLVFGVLYRQRVFVGRVSSMLSVHRATASEA